VIKTLVREVATAAIVAVLAIVWSAPLGIRVSSDLPGRGLGDNAMFLWNFWWMRASRAAEQPFFFTNYLFAPFGSNLTLHTHTALTAFIGATVLRPFGVLAALNVTTIASLALNGLCAYWLAHRITRRWLPSVVGGAIFAMSPFFAAHLNGHFNLTTAWMLPLVALAAERAMNGSLVASVMTGALIALTGYSDYYYVPYGLLLVVFIFGTTAIEWSVTCAPGMSRRAAAVIVFALAVDLLLIAYIVLTGGVSTEIGGLRVSMRETFNLRQLFWLLVIAATVISTRPTVRAKYADGWSAGRAARSLGTIAACFCVGAAPLLINGARLIQQGNYVSQRYLWRSGPAGVDAGTLLLGNPFNGLWGDAVQRSYNNFGINAIESGAWLGIVPLILFGCAIAYRRRDPAVRRWIFIGAVFGIWALGPHLYVFGWNSGMILPQALLRYIPIAANARIPGRAMVIVYLALAMLGAVGFSELRARRSFAWSALAIVLLFVDFVAAPFPTTAVECPSIYEVLRNRPERGAVADLPLGIADGFGDITPMNRQVLVCQLVHERPILGGVVARLSPNVVAAYRADPLLGWLLRLSDPHSDADVAPPDRQVVSDRLIADDVSFVVLNREAAGFALRFGVERVLPLVLIAEDANRSIYVVRGDPSTAR
jgi:hypothetical protein